MIGLRKSATASAMDLLEAQHKALLEGDFDQLRRLADALQTAFLQMGKSGGDKVTLMRIKEAAARNARLLTAAQAGVAVAQQHLDTARSPDLTTYNSEGQSQANIVPHSRDLIRR